MKFEADQPFKYTNLASKQQFVYECGVFVMGTCFDRKGTFNLRIGLSQCCPCACTLSLVAKHPDLEWRQARSFHQIRMRKNELMFGYGPIKYTMVQGMPVRTSHMSVRRVVSKSSGSWYENSLIFNSFYRLGPTNFGKSVALKLP